MSKYLKLIYKNKKTFAGFVILLIFLLMSLLGPIFIKLNMTVNYNARYQLPSIKHILGTDFAGRDTFMQLVHGSRDVLLVAFLAALLTVFIGFTLGALSGFAGKLLDKVISFISKIILTIPQFPIFMIIAVTVNITNPIMFALVLSLFSWPGLALSVRAQILSLKERDFMIADRLMGMSMRYIIFKEILPNISSYLAINFIMSMYNAILLSVGLMMMGVVPYTPTNWGAMIQIAYAQNAGMLNPRGFIHLFSPIVVMGIFQMGCISFASGLEEILNPRMKTN